ncbi:MAG: hypothetical protein FWC26_07010 [Fibromonadales bacterium]|nr:hypothetical protein [Fibromonadales bacterium]
MKIKLLLLFMLLFFSQIFGAHLTYYGPSGYIFVPSGYVAGYSKYTGFMDEELSLAFRSSFSFFGSEQELSFSSVYLFVDEDDGYGPKKVAGGLLPVIPSVKWNIEDKSGNIVRIGYSVGYTYVYGVYASATSQLIRTPILQPELTGAISLWTKRGYGLIGSRLQSADLRGNPLPFAVTAEAGWAGSMNSIGVTEESFFAFGTELNLGRNLSVRCGYRIDPFKYYDFDDNGKKIAPKEGQNKDGSWSLRLEFHFDGVKNAGGNAK